MTRYTFNVRRNADGSIDYDHYKAKARTARYETRVKTFRKLFSFLAGSRAQTPRKARTSGIACVSY